MRGSKLSRACIDYRAPGMSKALRAACPDGVDVYFDNVGGTVLEAALFAMNEKGRIVCCGAVSQYSLRPTAAGVIAGDLFLLWLLLEARRTNARHANLALKCASS